MKIDLSLKNNLAALLGFIIFLSLLSLVRWYNSSNIDVIEQEPAQEEVIESDNPYATGWEELGL